jgi:hypothetical protein
MVGVLLFDTSASGGVLARALDKLPASLPVLHIAAAPAPLNTYGNANQVLVEKRPGQFNGVQWSAARTRTHSGPQLCSGSLNSWSVW